MPRNAGVKIQAHKEKKVYIYSNGCVPNRLEGKKIEEFFKNLRSDVSNDHKQADLIIFNTCGFSGDKIRESVKLIHKLKREKKDGAEIILTGCLYRIDPDIIKKMYKGEVIDIKDFAKRFGSMREIDNLHVSANLIDILETTKKNIYHIVTSSGCLGKCTYCAIKKARGSIKSKPEKEIVDEFKNAIMLGYKRFILWGDDLGAYGSDISSNFVRLLKALIYSENPNLEYSFLLHRLNSQWLINNLKELWEVLETKKIELIYSPIQSGSNRILRLMKREYIIEDVKYCFRRIKKNFPFVKIKTDIMVGFPTETEKDFSETLKLLEDIKFDDIVVFKYSGVPKTPAYYLRGQLNKASKEKRVKAIFERFPNFRFSIDIEDDICWLMDKEESVKKGPFCLACYKSQKLLSELLTLRGLGNVYYQCYKCDWTNRT